MNSSDVPILILAFNRPQQIEQLIHQISKIRPSKIYVSIDGPRKSKAGEAELVSKVRSEIDKIDWQCEIHTLYRDSNVGLKKAVIESLDWIFSKEDFAIILEDDCHPIPDFFDFCAINLERYSNERKIMQISGNCFVPISNLNSNNHYFSTINDIWGWATWKRAWDLFDPATPLAEDRGLINLIERYFDNRRISKWFIRYVKEASSVDSAVWSTQWTISMIRNGGITVVPQTNLVQNRGFQSDATHATDKAFNIYLQFEPKPIESQKLPTKVEVNRKLDSERFKVIAVSDLNMRRRRRIAVFLREFAVERFPKYLVNFIKNLENSN